MNMMMMMMMMMMVCGYLGAETEAGSPSSITRSSHQANSEDYEVPADAQGALLC